MRSRDHFSLGVEGKHIRCALLRANVSGGLIDCGDLRPFCRSQSAAGFAYLNMACYRMLVAGRGRQCRDYSAEEMRDPLKEVLNALEIGKTLDLSAATRLRPVLSLQDARDPTVRRLPSQSR